MLAHLSPANIAMRILRTCLAAQAHRGKHGVDGAGIPLACILFADANFAEQLSQSINADPAGLASTSHISGQFAYELGYPGLVLGSGVRASIAGNIGMEMLAPSSRR